MRICNIDGETFVELEAGEPIPCACADCGQVYPVPVNSECSDCPKCGRSIIHVKASEFIEITIP